jgi:hypothetical protein
MRAQLRALSSPDVGTAELGAYSPTDPSEFGLLIEAEIGPAGDDGSDVFQFLAASPAWLATRAAAKGYRWGRGCLLMDRWDLRIVESAIRDLCVRAEGDDWPSVARQLGESLHWEFAGYEGR